MTRFAIKSSTKATLIWLLLVLLTLVTYGLGKAGYSGTFIISIVLASVLIKGRYIITDFMELRGTEKKWRWLVQGWLLLIVALIATAYRYS